MNRTVKHYADMATAIFQSPEAFRQYLAQRNPDESIELDGNKKCPLVEFAIHNGFPNPAVSPLGLHIHINDREVLVLGSPDPTERIRIKGVLYVDDVQWVFEFMLLVDNLFSEATTISVRDCLRVLSIVERGFFSKVYEVSEDLGEDFTLNLAEKLCNRVSLRKAQLATRK